MTPVRAPRAPRAVLGLFDHSPRDLRPGLFRLPNSNPTREGPLWESWETLPIPQNSRFLPELSTLLLLPEIPHMPFLSAFL